MVPEPMASEANRTGTQSHAESMDLSKVPARLAAVHSPVKAPASFLARQLLHAVRAGESMGM